MGGASSSLSAEEEQPQEPSPTACTPPIPDFTNPITVPEPHMHQLNDAHSVGDQMAQSPNSTFFTQEEINNMESEYETGGLGKVTPLIQRKLDEFDNTELNIAVTGESGAGKSTFINAMRGLQSDDQGAALSGTTETTMEPTPYPHPNLPNVCFWDLPGIGTTKFPANKYLTAMKFKRYDFFIIISHCRFRENDVKLAKEIKRLRKKFYFIRSKIDNDLNSIKKQRRNVNEEEELEKIRNDCVSKLQEAGIPSPKVFLISSFDLNLYDFSLLNKALEDDLQNNIKKSVFIMSLPNLNLEIVEKKRKELRKRVWMFATLSGVGGAVPVPGVSLACDIMILVGGVIHFRKCLGLDDASLQRLANKAGKPVEDLKAVVKTPLVGEITPELITRLHWGLTAATISVLELALDFIPVIGSIFGAGSSFLMTYKLLSAALDDLTENAQRVVKAAFGTSIQDQMAPSSTLIQKKVNELDSTELNIAVTGESGAGKSTFINAMRELQSDDEGAALSGTTETTMEPTRYPHPNLSNVCFWDLPGIGTTKFPADKYLREMNFKRYDFFNIISDCRFRENDVKLAKEIKWLGKNFYFIRSKIDNDLNSIKQQRGNVNEEEELEKIRNDCVSKLHEAGIPSPNVFLISSFDLNLYDFTLLSEALEDDLQNIKESVFRLALPNLNLEIVEKKRKELRKRVWMLATLSGAVGAVPVPGISLVCDIRVQVEGIIHFRKCLGLDDASLQRLANKAGKPVGVLKAAVKTPLVGEITPDLITRLQWGLAAVTISAFELKHNIVPVIGSIFGAGSSFLMTYKLLSDALNDLTENAQRVVKAAFGTD